MNAAGLSTGLAAYRADPVAAPAETFLQRRWARWALFIAFWTGLGLFNAGQSYILRRVARDLPFNVVDALVIGVVDWYLWGALVPLIYYLVRRFPLDQRNWHLSLPLHAAVGTLCTLLVLVLIVPVFQNFTHGDPRPPQEFSSLFVMHFLGGFIWYLWVYWAIVGVCHSYEYYRRYREREQKAVQLEHQLTQAELRVLKMQLHPHFLFNTLNAISALMHKDVDLADCMVARLGELLRSTLDNLGAHEVTLRQELDFVRPYLEIEQARLGERLQVHVDVDPDAMDLQVPNLILQPLVENAIRHGIAPYSHPGRIEIRAKRENGKLRLQVQDNGPGLAEQPPAAFRPGVGIATTRARLEQLYGADQQFEMANCPDGGLVVTLTIPAREVPAKELEANPVSV
jgi:two-component system LytT family sensor kinase